MAYMKQNHGSSKPEYRLPFLLLGSVLIPIGLLWYGWSLGAHWMLPTLGTAVFAFGIMYAYLPTKIYIMDMYPTTNASAFGACTVIRSAGSAIIPLCANPLYNRLGYAWGNSLLAFIALAFVPFAVLLICFGERIRTRTRR